MSTSIALEVKSHFNYDSPSVSARFTSAVVYQGLIMRLGILGGNVYIDFLISGLVEFPAALLILFTIERFGRRIPFASANIVAGAACFITALIPDSEYLATAGDGEQDIQMSSDLHSCLSLQVCSGLRRRWPASVGWGSLWPLRWWCLSTLNSIQRLSGKMYKLYTLSVVFWGGMHSQFEKSHLALVSTKVDTFIMSSL